MNMKTFTEYIKKNGIKLLAFPLLASMVSCQLDYMNTEAIDPSGAWGDKTMINAYLTNIYGGLMPGWDFDGDGSDESIDQNDNMSDYQRGINLSVSNNGINFDYEYIDRINFMLNELPNVPESVLSQEENDQIKGQALFWRAWRYWSYVKDVGGVPLITKVQDVNNEESLYVKRSPTSVCVDTIIADLNQAIALLPEKWTGNDYGRIDRCAALAFKGRVLLWYASPLFNRENDPARWKAAYDANKAALDACLAAGYALMPDFSQIWLTSGSANTEAIMFKRYKYADSSYNMWQLLPEQLTNGWACRCLPTLPSLLSFPLKDGSSMAMYPQSSFNENSLDTARLRTDATYNAQIEEILVSGMDPRFYASIVYNGARWNGRVIAEGPSETDDMANRNASRTGYYLKKFLTDELNLQQGQTAQHNWIAYRYAEVLLNYAEAVNELYGPDEVPSGQQMTARQALMMVRDRASTDLPEVTAVSKDAFRDIVKHERQVELAFEDHRYWDLLRWKDAVEVLNRPVKGVRITKENGVYVYTTVDVATRTFHENNYRLPFLRSEVENSQGTLEQNPGY